MPIDLGNQTVARWPDPDPAHVPLLARGGIEAVLLDKSDAAFEAACARLGIVAAPASTASSVITRGLWPGIRRTPGPDDGADEVTSASREPWVDSNGYLVAVERALNPARPAVLGYLPNARAGLDAGRMVPFETLELALIEARVMGGNYILALEPRYREALPAGDAKAMAAWDRLGRTARWLKQHASLFGRPSLPMITALVDDGPRTRELANLLYRRNASPRLAFAASPPAPAPQRIRALVAAGLTVAPEATPKAILAHAEAGATVVVDSPYSGKPVKQQKDRSFFAVGKGEVVSYHKRIVDPSEFALDVIDLINHRNRAVRIWNAPAVIAVATEGERPNEALLLLVNYGSRSDQEIQSRIQGAFRGATLMRPGAEPMELKTSPRGTTTEVYVPEIDRLAVVRFS